MRRDVGVHIAGEPQHSTAKFCLAFNDSADAVSKSQIRAYLGPFAGPYQGRPTINAEFFDEQQFNIRIRRPDACRNNFCVVEHQ